MIKRLLAGACFGIAASLCFGQQLHLVEVSWGIPTTRADGSSLAVTELSKYTLYYICGNNTAKFIDISPATLTRTTVQGLPAGSCTFTMTATDTTGLQSKLSLPLTFTIKPFAPISGGIRHE